MALVRYFLFIAGILSTMVMMQAFAHPTEERSWHGMSPEERQEIRQQMRDEWQRLSPEEKQAKKKAYKEYREGKGSRDEADTPRRRWKDLSSEERDQLKGELYMRNTRRNVCNESSGAPDSLPVTPKPKN